MKRRYALFAFAAILIATIPTTADARHTSETICAKSDMTITMSARRHAGRHHHYRGGGLICGATQMRHFGKTDPELRMARKWAVKFPHTSAHPGAVVVQSRNGHDSAGHQGGHVSRIVSNTGPCRAIVADERGTYERDICSRLIAYVDPNGSPLMSSPSSRHRQRLARHGGVTISSY